MTQKIPHFVKSTLGRLKSGDVIACQLSQSKEAGVIAASQDGLLPDCPQTYQVIGGCHADIT